MDLFRRRSVRQHNNLVMRLGCFLVTVSMIGSFFFQPPKAKAILTEASLATSVIWAFMQSAGLSFSGNNAGSQAWIDSCQRWYNDFMDSREDSSGDFFGWLGFAGGAADFVKSLSFAKNPTGLGYQLSISKGVAVKLAEFTRWFAGKFGLSVGGAGSFDVPDNIIEQLVANAEESTMDHFGYSWARKYDWIGTYRSVLFDGTEYHLILSDKPVKFVSKGNYLYLVFDSFTFYKDFLFTSSMRYKYPSDPDNFDGYSAGTEIRLALLSDVVYMSSPASVVVSQPGELTPPVDDTGDNATIITVPDIDGDIAGIEDLLQQILDKLAANDLTVSGSVAATPEPEQPDEDTPDLDGLGLPALGAALITRFPFSIPWDIVRGIELLAAPSEAPYWEVDFLAPIAHRVGGWKGSTTVVIDMGDYPIIGQVCRWTSMIGFCLILASGTKKLIWTA